MRKIANFMSSSEFHFSLDLLFSASGNNLPSCLVPSARSINFVSFEKYYLYCRHCNIEAWYLPQISINNFCLQASRGRLTFTLSSLNQFRPLLALSRLERLPSLASHDSPRSVGHCLLSFPRLLVLPAPSVDIPPRAPPPPPPPPPLLIQLL